MVKNGADVNSKSSYSGETPLDNAVAANSSLSSLFLSLNYPLESERFDEHFSPVFWYFCIENEIVEYLIQHGADVNVVDKNQYTLLHTATLYGGLLQIKFIIFSKKKPSHCFI